MAFDFDARGSFSISDGSWFGKDVIIFVANISLSVHKTYLCSINSINNL